MIMIGNDTTKRDFSQGITVSAVKMVSMVTPLMELQVTAKNVLAQEVLSQQTSFHQPVFWALMETQHVITVQQDMEVDDVRNV